ncbi:hypothetical protein L905_23455 [Agrobacterium sp. TS43]|nr:hypothetical protein L905_23455 [Agrobacterium sp. TS43]KVK61108.1 hypothetical protein L906_21720 [Agrobacterium sp. TS45]
MKHVYGAVSFANGLQLNISQLFPPTSHRSGYLAQCDLPDRYRNVIPLRKAGVKKDQRDGGDARI